MLMMIMMVVKLRSDAIIGDIVEKRERDGGWLSVIKDVIN